MTKKSDSTQVGMFSLPSTCSQRQLTIITRIEGALDEVFVVNTLIPLIEQKSSISLRSLDWLVTNYAKKFNIVSEVRNGHIFNIYHGYKTALSHFRRKNFDPFRRRTRIHMTHGGVTYETTVGQCNFFHWANANGVLRYAFENSALIESDMNSASAIQKAERKQQLDSGVPHRRKELSNAPASKCSIYSVNTRVCFRCIDNEDDVADGLTHTQTDQGTLSKADPETGTTTLCRGPLAA